MNRISLWYRLLISALLCGQGDERERRTRQLSLSITTALNPARFRATKSTLVISTIQPSSLLLELMSRADVLGTRRCGRSVFGRKIAPRYIRAFGGSNVRLKRGIVSTYLPSRRRRPTEDCM